MDFDSIKIEISSNENSGRRAIEIAEMALSLYCGNNLAPEYALVVRAQNILKQVEEMTA